MKSLKKSLAVSAVTLFALTGLATSAQAAAPGDVFVSAISSDAPYADVFGNRNKEWIQFTNELGGLGSVNIGGWVVGDSYVSNYHTAHGGGPTDYPTCNKAVMPAINLDDGKSVRVYSGPGFNGWSGNTYRFYMNHGIGATHGCGTNGHFWTNNSDTGYVWNALGNLVSKGFYDNSDGVVNDGEDLTN